MVQVFLPGDLEEAALETALVLDMMQHTTEAVGVQGVETVQIQMVVLDFKEL